jgi:hypothetical protein
MLREHERSCAAGRYPGSDAKDGWGDLPWGSYCPDVVGRYGKDRRRGRIGKCGDRIGSTNELVCVLNPDQHLLTATFVDLNPAARKRIHDPGNDRLRPREAKNQPPIVGSWHPLKAGLRRIGSP